MVNSNLKLLAICSLIVLGHYGLRPSQAQSVHKTKQDMGAPDWSKLEFDDDRRIEKARIVVMRPKGLLGEDANIFDFAVNRPPVLKLIETAVANSSIPVPKKGGAYAGALPLMRIEITTNKDTFNIQVFESSFALADQPTAYDSSREFYCTSLACVLDALLKKHIGSGLSEKSLAQLTGKAHVEGTVKWTKQLIAETKELDPSQK